MHQYFKYDFEIDVCVIGGSIAGNYLACLLAEQNVKCCVIEEHEILGLPFQCAGIISQKILNLTAFPKSLILNRVKTAKVVAPNNQSIELSGKENPVIIDRVEFDKFFGKKAQEMGVKYYLNEKYISHWSLPHNKVLIKTSKHRIVAKIVVGADGPFSKVAKRYGIKNTTIPAVQARMKFKHDLDKTAMYFHPKWEELFGYIVPEGNNGICRIGLATSVHPNKAFNIFLKKIEGDSSQIISRQGGALPFGYPKRFAFKNAVLLGDSACMVKATTGGGIVMLVSAAKILAPAISKSLEKNDFSQRFLRKNYEKPVKCSLGIELRLHFLIRLILMELKSEGFNRFFRMYLNSKDLQEIVENYADMDFPLNLVRKLLFNREFMQFVFPLIIRNLHIIPKIIKIFIY
jgi:geranylgeranyl reductase family protein